MNELGFKLLLLRKNKGLTQKELANKLYLSDKTISKWETGEVVPSLEMLITLTNFYKISLDELLNEKINHEFVIFKNTIQIIFLGICCVIQFSCFLLVSKNYNNLIILILSLIGILISMFNIVINIIKLIKYKKIDLIIFYLSILNIVSFILMFIIALINNGF